MKTKNQYLTGDEKLFLILIKIHRYKNYQQHNEILKVKMEKIPSIIDWIICKFIHKKEEMKEMGKSSSHIVQLIFWEMSTIQLEQHRCQQQYQLICPSTLEVQKDISGQYRRHRYRHRLPYVITQMQSVLSGSPSG